MTDEPDWEAVRRDYHGTTLKTSEIYAKYSISRLALSKRIRAEGWTVRLSASQMKVAAKAAGTASLPPLVAEPRPDATTSRISVKPLKPIAQRRKILERLHNTIEKKLRLLEQRLDRQETGVADEINSADFERDTRNIGLLIRNFEKLSEIQHDQRGKRITGAAAKSASIAASALADEADRLRRELAERLQRLVDPAGE